MKFTICLLGECLYNLQAHCTHKEGGTIEEGLTPNSTSCPHYKTKE